MGNPINNIVKLLYFELCGVVRELIYYYSKLNDLATNITIHVGD